MCHQRKLWRLTLFHQVNHLYKLRLKQDPKRSLEGHRLKFFFGKKFIHSIKLFVYNLSGNLLIFNKSPSIRYVFTLNIKPSCQTLSKAFEISRKIPLVSAGGLQSKLL